MVKATVTRKEPVQKPRPGFSKTALVLHEEQFSKDKDLVERRVRISYPDAKSFDYELGAQSTVIGNTYYVEFKSARLEEDDSYYFCLVDGDTVEAFDSEIELLNHALSLLDRRRSVVQRLADFTIADVLSLLIVMVLSIALVIGGVRGEYSKEIIGLFGIVVGYLFGRKT